MFNAFIFPGFHVCKAKKSKNRPENRGLGLVEPPFSIFRPIFTVFFIFRGVVRPFSRTFSSVTVAVAIPPSFFQYFPDVERHGSGDDPRAVLGSLAAS